MRMPGEIENITDFTRYKPDQYCERDYQQTHQKTTRLTSHISLIYYVSTFKSVPNPVSDMLTATAKKTD